MGAAVLFAFWRGPVTWFEKLSVLSARAAGHRLILFSHYQPIPELIECGAEWADARELLDISDEKTKHLLDRHPAHFSDHLRLEGLARDVGIWVDLDCIILRPIPQPARLFAAETDQPDAMFGNAVLRLPRDCPALHELLDFYRRRPFCPILPHWSLARRLSKTFEWRTDWVWRPDKVKTVLGPDALTGALRRHALDGEASPRCRFYPLPPTRTREAHDPYAPRNFLDADTVLVHMWAKSAGNSAPVRGSWIGDMADRLGLGATAEAR